MMTTGWFAGRGSAALRAMTVAAVVTLAPIAGMRDAHAAAKGASGDFEWSGTIAPGKSIEVKGINGDIQVDLTTGSEVKVAAKKSARKSDPGEVTIEVIEHAGGVTVCAKYPTPKGERANECKPGEGGRMSTHDNDVQVAFTVQVPAGVSFVGRTVNGDVRASGLTGAAEAHSVNGSIKLETRGTARATTVNGSIVAEMGALAGDVLEFESVNGGITVILPAASGAEVEASTVNGNISSDFPLTVQGKFSPRSLHGTIGKGGPELKMSTVNGNVRLRVATS